MTSKTSKRAGLLGAALAVALFGAKAQAHECHALGQPKNDSIGQYWLCAGFTVEDGDRPRAGTVNNIDIIPIWVTHPDTTTDVYLDTRKGDTVDIIAQLIQIKGAYYDVPHDPVTFALFDDNFFFKTQAVGFSSPISTNPSYIRIFTNLTPVTFVDDGQTSIAYRSPFDFVTPNPGLYTVLVQGTLKRKGQAPVTFIEKFVSAQPQIPFGPKTVSSATIADFAGAPEGWFDSVKPANWVSPALASAASASQALPGAALVAAPVKRASPPPSVVLKRFRK